MANEKPPLYYNLGAITRETGLHPDTLRAWERRYDLPQPTRSEGGQRLYSQRDLEIIRWLIAKQETGLRISQAADLWHTQIEAGIDPLEEIRKASLGAATQVVEGDNLTAYRKAWIETCLDFNNLKADQILNEAFAMFPPETVSFDIMFAGLSEIGAMWYRGEATVQQEHFASALVTRKLNTLVASAPVPTRPERIVIAAPPEENHMLAALMINFLLRRRGFDVVYLGADVPVENFRLTIESLEPSLVILTAHLLITTSSLLDLANELDGLNLRLVYGGSIFIRIPELTERIPGDFLGDDLSLVVPVIETLLQSPPPKLAANHPDLPVNIEELREKLPLIENKVNSVLNNYPVMLSAPNNLISNYIFAAISLGDISYLMADLEWVHRLMSNFKLPNKMLIDFLKIYSQAIEDTMHVSASPLVDWLHQGAQALADMDSNR